MNRKVYLPCVVLFLAACSGASGERAIHVTGEYGRFGDAYRLHDCATDDEYSLMMRPEVFADFVRQTAVAGAGPDETVSMTVDAASTAEQRFLYVVSRISRVRRGGCNSVQANG